MRRQIMWVMRATRRHHLVLALVLVAPGCNGDATTPFTSSPIGDGSQLYWSMTLSDRAVALSTVAPYDTIRLVATPRDQNGAAIQGLGTATFRTTDPEHVHVDSAGLVRAIGISRDVAVVAELTEGNARHADTVYVSVTGDSAPPALASLSIQPAPSDSAIAPLNGDGAIALILTTGGSQFIASQPKLFTAQLTDASENAIADVPVSYISRDLSVATIDRVTGELTGKRPGRVTIVASATVYGVRKSDSLDVTITWPVWATFWIKKQTVGLGGSTQLVFEPNELTIRSGGTVFWGNLSGLPVDIVFDDAGAALEYATLQCFGGEIAESGDIAAFGEPIVAGEFILSTPNCRSRRFSVPGSYPFHSTKTGSTGRVIVSDELPPVTADAASPHVSTHS